jgi:hypothetical protein
MTKAACACCGFLVLDERGNYAICPICFWEDDIVQIADPWFDGGANSPALVQAQRTFAQIGATEQRFLKYVRAPRTSDAKDPEWRAVVETDKHHVTTPREIEEKRDAGLTIPYEYRKRGVAH